ncbi:MT-A70 family methyltransferase [Rhodoplanes azumiensis]|uniref:MT-A70 family methyltransferase n=1 Tax=Rhodoplanes azumiensis TaxID=1897628 RepID=A0ABW5AS52_9BRAD
MTSEMNNGAPMWGRTWTETEPERMRLLGHEIANVLPMLEYGEVAELESDIKRNGLIEPVVVFEDRILDGRNRQRACRTAGVTCRYVEFTGTHAEAVTYVVSRNLTRRHLTVSQRAMFAAKLATLRDGQRQVGNFADVPTQAQAATLANVSERTVRTAREVVTDGTPALVEAVQRGEVVVSVAAEVAKLPAGEQVEIVARGPDEILAEAKRIRAERLATSRNQRLAAVAAKAKNNPDFMLGERYSVIYADPPWYYTGGSPGDARRIDSHYPVMSIDEICELPVDRLAADDALLLLWCTAPLLPEALRVLTSWGFEYRTHAVWDKQVAGTGHWFRGAHELVLVGVRGNFPAPLPGTQPPSVHREQKTVHSRKPSFVHEFVERLWPDLPRVELFARGPARPGWSVWGNEVEVIAEAARNDLDDEIGPDEQDDPGEQADSDDQVEIGSDADEAARAGVWDNMSGVERLMALRRLYDATPPEERWRHGDSQTESGVAPE